jgi:hypothetical protein
VILHELLIRVLHLKVRGGQSAREDAQSSHRENLFFISILDNFETCQLLDIKEVKKLCTNRKTSQ